jgi:ABC-type sugar transport system ATPase subunit
MAGLTLSAVQKRYGETVVLDGVDLQLIDGEYLVLVGPSGCGKSTLLRAIAGLVEVSGGTIKIGDRDVTDVSPRDRDVAMVFQSYALYPHMTVRQNIAFPLRIAGISAAEQDRQVGEVAEQLDLVELLDRLPSELSGGQRQRVAMGRAIVRRPSVFLFDEPLSNLDAGLRTRMRVELKRLHQRLKTTVVHVTHDQVEALTLADRIMVLNGGVVQQIGTPRALFETPTNLFVATFIGSPSMNTFQDPKDVNRTLGVRPTDITVGVGDVQATVEVIESMGATALIHCKWLDDSIAVSVEEPHEIAIGDTISLRFDVTHCFNTATGARQS